MNDIVLTLPETFSVNFEDCRRGNRMAEEVLTNLYVKLRPSLLSYVYYLTGSTCEAEDLIQVAFLQLVAQLKQDVEIRNLRGWLYRVVHNLAVEHAQRTDRRESLIRLWLTVGDTRPRTDSAEDGLIKREQIEKALGVLNERERHALMLRAEGLSYQEIAETLKISPKSVSVYLARELKKFSPKK